MNTLFRHGASYDEKEKIRETFDASNIMKVYYILKELFFLCHFLHNHLIFVTFISEFC